MPKKKKKKLVCAKESIWSFISRNTNEITILNIYNENTKCAANTRFVSFAKSQMYKWKKKQLKNIWIVFGSLISDRQCWMCTRVYLNHYSYTFRANILFVFHFVTIHIKFVFLLLLFCCFSFLSPLIFSFSFFLIELCFKSIRMQTHFDIWSLAVYFNEQLEQTKHNFLFVFIFFSKF